MPRTLDPAAHALRRDTFVDGAQRLIARGGYERLSIADLLAELGTSRGAFYHYFDSKEALLEAVVDRMADGAVAELAQVAGDATIPAAEKIESMFAALARFKGERSELIFELMETWNSDANAVVREHLRTEVVARLEPLIAQVVREGVEQGVFDVASADDTASVLVSLIQGASERAGRMLLAVRTGVVRLPDVKRFSATYAEAFRRVLGLERPITLMDDETLEFWFG